MGDGRSLRRQTQSVMARASVAPKSGAFPPAGTVPKIVVNHELGGHVYYSRFTHSLLR
jgi:hypothetical protein